MGAVPDAVDTVQLLRVSASLPDSLLFFCEFVFLLLFCCYVFADLCIFVSVQFNILCSLLLDIFTCTHLEQAECALEADRPQGQGARAGCADISHHIRPENPSVVRGQAFPHHHLQHWRLRQPHHTVLWTWVLFNTILENLFSEVIISHVRLDFYKICTSGLRTSECFTVIVFQPTPTQGLQVRLLPSFCASTVLLFTVLWHVSWTRLGLDQILLRMRVR